MRVYYNKGYRLARFDGKREDQYDSQYIEQNVRGAKRLKDRDLWKTSGEGAEFLGVPMAMGERRPQELSLGGLASLGGDLVGYVANVDDLSAVYEKDLAAPEEDERHIVHGYARRIKGLDYSPERHCYAFAASEDGLTYQIVLLDPETVDDRTLTDGDIVADNPFFDGDKLLFNCYLVGRDENGNFAGYSPSMLLSLDLESMELTELKRDEKRSLVAPKRDGDGNLYYLSRPPYGGKKKSNLFLDIILFPYRLIKAFVGFLDAFSICFAGEGLRTRDNSPARTVQKSEKELFIEGNVINAKKNLRANAKNSKHPGVLPKSWTLERCEPDGSHAVTVARGVLAYDVAEDGTVVYSNGKHILALKDRLETHLAASELATVIQIGK